ncbi:hypothetical protein [Streptomyces sp. NBC_01294]|uniref:hypothetical protein n=1 Tax=Streptomyces sp. NBC_01294 TaxID=2903815 RepID=UPI002DD7F81A|nr:hypothetical protein [Streptomyces sp. NBC_01294]WRZ56420.1 hypothetical protein OG534_08005 [Streptomyces sp. NBC_01294]
MTSPTLRGVWSITTPDTAGSGLHAVGEPSAELLDRALVGWEHFTSTTDEKPSEG